MRGDRQPRGGLMAARRKGNDKALFIAGLLAWLVPGAGYMYLGMRRRGIIVCGAIWVTFFVGLVLGGVEIVTPQHSKWWFLAQIPTGLAAVIAVLLQDPNVPAGWGRGVDLGQVYTGVAGLLNVLCILDTLMRSQQPTASASTGRTRTIATSATRTRQET